MPTRNDVIAGGVGVGAIKHRAHGREAIRRSPMLNATALRRGEGVGQLSRYGKRGNQRGRVMVRAIGVDPGSRFTGWGIVEGDGSRLRYIHHGTIKLPAGKTFPERLRMIFDQLNSAIAEYGPECMAVEEIFFAKNVKSALSLGQARGAVLLAGTSAGLSIHEYSALRIKQAVAGYGRASKEQVAAMIGRLFRIDGQIEPNAADALAVAVCHLNTSSSRCRWKVPEKS